jgi:hypothetical protein
MAWRITGGPDPGPATGRDAVGWMWTIERDDESRRLLVEVSGQAMAVAEAAPLPPDTREARETQGRSAVESVLERDDPPGRVTFGTINYGRSEEPYRA